MTTNPEVDGYFATATAWPAEQRALRVILQRTPLVETWKWKQPVYTHDGANLVTIWAFQDSCGLGFFKGVLLSDPDDILVPVGENSRSAMKIVFRSVAEIQAGERRIAAYVAEAIEREDAWEQVEFAKEDLECPEELIEALAADPELASAWDALTPGRRRSHILHVSGAKKSDTRRARIERNRANIMDGKNFQGR
ncbi:MAG: YdeI/OmpD-associated family protein [Actinomycetota bacterium]